MNKLFTLFFLMVSTLVYATHESEYTITPIELRNEPGKIIYLISPPRSLSTTFLRMMQARKDFIVHNEPSMKAHELMFCPQTEPNKLYRADAPATFQEVKEMLFKEARNSNVFAKEISFAVINFFYRNSADFITNPRVHVVFLIRNPHHTLLSFYLKKQSMFNANPVGYKNMYELIQFVQKNAVNKPHIVFAEDLYNYPRETVQAFCKAVDIPFYEHSLYWEDLGEDFTGNETWGEIKKELDNIQYWHGAAIHSTGFTKPREYQVDLHGKPTFSEIEDSEMKRTCIEVYLHELFYFNLIELEKHLFIKPFPDHTIKA